MSAQTFEVSLFGVGTVLRLERDAWSVVKLLRQTTNEHAPPPPPPPVSQRLVARNVCQVGENPTCSVLA